MALGLYQMGHTPLSEMLQRPTCHQISLPERREQIAVVRRWLEQMKEQMP